MMKSINIDVVRPEGDPPIYFRNGSSDSFILKKNLIDGKFEYNFPQDAKPNVIWDVGANIGIISIVMTKLYPNAIIHAFEPQRDNFALLEKNVGPYKKIVAHNYGLGAFEATRILHESPDDTNFGAYSMSQQKPGQVEGEQVRIRHPERLEMQWPDLLKIDCEGAEDEILRAMGPALANVKWIVGEIHPQFYGGYEALKTLERTHHVAFFRQMEDAVFNFWAKARTLE